jgi:hypothetical protein
VALAALKKAESHLRMAYAFSSNATPRPEKQKWVSILGEYRYFCQVLGGFDPAKSNEIAEKCDHLEIADSYVTLLAYNARDVK